MFTGSKSSLKFYLSATTRALLFDGIAYLFVLLFVYTAANKLWKFDSFERVLSMMPLIGQLGTLIAGFIPAAEILISIALLIPFCRRAGMLATFILMLIFTIYLVFMVFYAKDLPCNCGGVLSSMSWQQHITFNMMFILLSAVALKIHRPSHH